MKKVLFVSYGGGHITTLIPLINALRERKDIKTFIFGLTTAQDFLKKEGIDFFGYANLPFPPTPYTLKRGEELFSELDVQKINCEESIAYLGWNIVELEETYGLKIASDLYAERGRFCFFPIRLMKKLIQYYEIDLLISTNSPRSERAAIEAVSMLGIPSICVVDGFAKYESEWIANPGFSKKVCVFSDSVKKNLERLGRNKDDIIVTGNPSFDIFYAPFPEEKINQFREQASIPRDKKLILYAPSCEGDFHIYNGGKGNTSLPQKALEKLIQFTKEREEYFLVIRPHPSHKFDNFSFSERVFLDQGFDLLTLLHASDIVVTTASTVGIQAQIVGKPLICVNLSVYAEDVNYEEFGEVVRVNSLDELDKALICVTNEIYKNQGKKVETQNATREILNTFNSLIEKNPLRII